MNFSNSLKQALGAARRHQLHMTYFYVILLGVRAGAFPWGNPTGLSILIKALFHWKNHRLQTKSHVDGKINRRGGEGHGKMRVMEKDPLVPVPKAPASGSRSAPASSWEPEG